MQNNNPFLKIYKPITPSLRHLCLVNKVYVYNNQTLLNLKKIKLCYSGRNNSGTITVKHRGGRKKVYYRLVNMNVDLWNIPYKLIRVEYDPNRSSFISLLCSCNGLYFYNLYIDRCITSQTFISFIGILESYNVGYSSLLKYIPESYVICNIELFPGNGSVFKKSAGQYALLLKKNLNTALIKYNTSFIKTISIYNYATLGKISNIYHRYKNLGKAGRSRWLGIRPTVRGVAMNPIDHPHGGGEGKKSPKVCAMSTWGKLSKGIKTRNNKR